MSRKSESSDDVISNRGMVELASSIEAYLQFYESILIIPNKNKGDSDKVKQSIKMCKELIKKLKHHDKSVFCLDDVDTTQLLY